jgi:hypothetical protein
MLFHCSCYKELQRTIWLRAYVAACCAAELAAWTPDAERVRVGTIHMACLASTGLSELKSIGQAEQATVRICGQLQVHVISNGQAGLLARLD